MFNLIQKLLKSIDNCWNYDHLKNKNTYPDRLVTRRSVKTGKNNRLVRRRCIRKGLKLEPLIQRRKSSRLILFCKGLHQQAAIPINILQRPKRTTRTMHSKHFINIAARTETLKASFMPNTVKDWNLLPSEVIQKIKAARSPVESLAAILKGVSKC